MQDKYVSKQYLQTYFSEKNFDSTRAEKLVNDLANRGYTIEGFNEPAPTVTQKFGSDIAKRATDLKTAVTDVGAKMSEAKTLGEVGATLGRGVLRSAGSVAGGVMDTFGAATEVADNMLGNIPSNAIKAGSEAFLATETGKKALASIQGGLDSYEAFKVTNPEAAKDIENVIDIASVFPAIKGIGVAAKGVETATKGVTTGVKNIAESTKGLATKLVDSVSADPEAKVSRILERSSPADVDRIVTLAKEAATNGEAPTPFEVTGNLLADSAKQIKSKLDEVGRAKSAILEPLREGLGAFKEETKDLLGNLYTLKNSFSEIDASSKKIVDAVIRDAQRVNTKLDADRLIDKLQDALYSGNQNQTIVQGSALDKRLRSILGDYNTKLKSTLPKEYADLNDKYARTIDTLNVINKSLGDVVEGVPIRGASLIKQFFSPSGSKAKEIFEFVKNETGVDLAKEATLSKFAMELFDDARSKSLLQGITDVPTSISGVVGKALEKFGGDRLQETMKASTIRKAKSQAMGSDATKPVITPKKKVSSSESANAVTALNKNIAKTAAVTAKNTEKTAKQASKSKETTNTVVKLDDNSGMPTDKYSNDEMVNTYLNNQAVKDLADKSKRDLIDEIDQIENGTPYGKLDNFNDYIDSMYQGRGDLVRKLVTADRNSKDGLSELLQSKTSYDKNGKLKSSKLARDFDNIADELGYGYGGKSETMDAYEYLQDVVERYSAERSKFKDMQKYLTQLKKKVTSTNRIITEETYLKAKQELDDIMRRQATTFKSSVLLGAEDVIETIPQYLTMAAYHIENGVRTVAELGERLAKDGYKLTKEQLDRLFSEGKLYNEAKKYKSAEEFVKAQGEPVYHGGTAEYKELRPSNPLKGISGVPKDIMADTVSLTHDKKLAQEVADGVSGENGGHVNEVFINPRKILDLTGKNLSEDAKRYVEVNRKELTRNGFVHTWGTTKDGAKFLSDNGYDGVKIVPEGDIWKGVELRITNPDIIKTKSQLTDIYNKANKSVSNTTEDTLIAEAKKYKSAEEFVNKNIASNFKQNDFNVLEIPGTIRLTHTSPEQHIKDFSIQKMDSATMDRNFGDYFYVSNSTIPDYGDFAYNFYYPKNKVLDLTDYQKSKISDEELFKKYDVLQVSKDEFIVKDPSKLQKETKSQLTDIWNKTNKKVAVELPTGLEQEAKKYKSAEEFVKAQGEPLYHGTTRDFTTFDKTKLGEATGARSAKKGFFLTDDFGTARSYPTAENWKKVQQYIDNGNIKEAEKLENLIFNKQDPAQVKEAFAKLNNPKIIDAEGSVYGDYRDELENAIDEAVKNGNDGLIIKNLSDNADYSEYTPATHYLILDENKIITKQQLTDIYNKANKSAENMMSERFGSASTKDKYPRNGKGEFASKSRAELRDMIADTMQKAEVGITMKDRENLLDKVIIPQLDKLREPKSDEIIGFYNASGDKLAPGQFVATNPEQMWMYAGKDTKVKIFKKKDLSNSDTEEKTAFGERIYKPK